MSGKVAELRDIIHRNNKAESIVSMYTSFNQQRNPWKKEVLELRDYTFATDTTKTSNKTLPWKNSTTYPKLTQIRDNLHANYMQSLFPNDNWLKWEGYNLQDETRDKKEAIEGYMFNKLKESGFISTISQLVYDYIDYGNAFGDVIFVKEEKVDPITGEIIPGYIGPKLIRISPLDIVINPSAIDFASSPKITRSLKTIGELKLEIGNSIENSWMMEAINKSENLRSCARSGIYTVEDFEKACGYSIDGFGNFREYLQSPYVEILEFEGNIHDPSTGTLLKDHVITVIDRTYVVRDEPMPSWLGKGNKAHVGWRLRPDNLYAMGPLANLVGLQYRIDHLENLKADVFDLIAYPPLKIYGEVEEFNWGPGEEIHLDSEGSDVQMLVPETTILSVDQQIDILERRMEEAAGAPKQAMGIRTPGEKTAWEVQALENAAGRIFQEKVIDFERDFLEPILNSMLEESRRNFDMNDVIRVLDDDLGVTKFLSITKEDITAKGKIAPVGARHFSSRAQLLQNLSGVFGGPMGQMISPHVSTKALAKLVEDTLGLQKFDLIRDNVGIDEQAETQQLVNSYQEELEVQQSLPVA